MAYVPIPKDLTKVRQKLILNLTKRQVICFSGGALIGVPLFFLTKNALPGSMATFLMIFAMMPFFALGLYEKNGESLGRRAAAHHREPLSAPETQNLSDPEHLCAAGKAGAA